MEAAQKGKTDIVQLLLLLESKDDQVKRNLCNNFLEILSRTDVLKGERADNISNFFKDHRNKTDPDYKSLLLSSKDSTALHYAASKGHIDTFIFLKKYFPDTNIKNKVLKFHK